MLFEALDFLTKLGRKTGETQIIKPCGDHSREREIIYPDGVKSHRIAQRAARVQNVATLGSFVRAVGVLTRNAADEARDCVVSCRLGKIVARLHELKTGEDIPEDSVVWSFEKHPFVTWLERQPSSLSVSASELRSLLRMGLGEIDLAPADLIAQLSLVNFDEQLEVTDEDRDSMRRLGKTITAKVRGIDTLPDEFHVTFPPSPFFPNLSPATVSIGLRAVPESSNFRLTPKAGDLALVVATAEEEIVEAVGAAFDQESVNIAAVLAGSRD